MKMPCSQSQKDDYPGKHWNIPDSIFANQMETAPAIPLKLSSFGLSTLQNWEGASYMQLIMKSRA